MKWTVRALQQLVPARARSRSTSTSRRSRTARQRAKAVDFSKGYYFVNQSLVGRKGKPIASARSINGAQEVQARSPDRHDELRLHRQRDQACLDAELYDTNDEAVQALKNGLIDGLVVDLPTAFYVTAVQVPDGKVSAGCRRAGRRSASGSSSRRAAS